MATVGERESARLAWRLGIGRDDTVPDPEPGPEAPAAPVLSLVEPVTNPPAFDVDLPSGNGAPLDAAAGDVLRIQITLSTDTGFASVVEEVTVTLDGDDLIADTIQVSGLDAQSDGTYIARARLERGGANGAWSETSASFEIVTAAQAYTYRGAFAYDGASLSSSGSIDIGPAADDRVVIVGSVINTNIAVTGATANGVPLDPVVADLTNASGGAELWAVLVTAGSGSQTIAVTWDTGAAYADRVVHVWTVTGLNSNTAKDTAANEADISVDAGDLLFAVGMGIFLANLSFATFTEAPTEHSTNSNAFESVGGDLTVASTNAAFSTAASNEAASVVATFR